MLRSRTVSRKIPELPRGVRLFDGRWHWRATEQATKEIEKRLRAAGMSMGAGKTPNAARLWLEKHVSPLARPDRHAAGQ